MKPVPHRPRQSLGEPGGDSRRSFLLSTGSLVTTAWLGTHWAAISAAAHHAEDMAAADIAAAPPWTGYQFLTAEEALNVDAVAAQIVPSGATPGAREAHAVRFIDRSLSTYFSAWAVEYRAGLGEFAAKFRAANPGTASFAVANPAQQVAYLETVDRTSFFETTRLLTVLGMFSSPKYGGNYQGAGWTMIGFEDRHVFAPPFGYYDAQYVGFVPYSVKPA
jgi:gluconate 2-dehydrogenase gamma chain